MKEMQPLPEPKGQPAPLITNENGQPLRNPEWAKYADKANRMPGQFSPERDLKKEQAVVEHVIFSQ